MKANDCGGALMFPQEPPAAEVFSNPVKVLYSYQMFLFVSFCTDIHVNQGNDCTGLLTFSIVL